MKYLCVCFFVFITSPITASDEISGLIHQWLILESQRGQLRSEWEQNKAVLDSQVVLYKKQIQEYNGLIAKQADSATDLDKKRKGIAEKQNKLEDKQARIKGELKIAVHHLHSTIEYLPPFAKKTVIDELQAIDIEAVNIGKTVDSTIALIRALHELNGKINLNTSNLSVNDNGKSINVTQVYVGLSHGWYVSEDNSNFGYGMLTKSGWRWWHNESARNLFGEKFNARDVREILAIIENPQQAKLSRLPITIN